jgi:hypothetical protein
MCRPSRRARIAVLSTKDSQASYYDGICRTANPPPDASLYLELFNIPHPLYLAAQFR